MRSIALVVSDIDGTLVTPDKTLTPAARAAVASLREAGILFVLVSSRPARGMASLIEMLGVTAPCAAFNGAVLFEPGGDVLESHPLADELAHQAMDLAAEAGANAWVFAGDAWYLTDPEGDEVWREKRTVGFEPIRTADLRRVGAPIGKVVAVSDHPERLDLCQARARAAMEGRANVMRSQSYYLDFTDPAATKGAAVTALAARLGVPLSATVVIGDMDNDVSMFAVAGLAIAMGQAPQAVREAAGHVTASNREDGFAAAIRTIVLPAASAAR
jgi:Cof subfamily protein (haloacid dehalogenase superfamily)